MEKNNAIMKCFLARIWTEDHGVLTFEWILLATLLVLGIVGAFSAARDAVVVELGDVAGAIVAIDQSYSTECYGVFEDTPATPVVIERPADPPVSQ